VMCTVVRKYRSAGQQLRALSTQITYKAVLQSRANR
jgi:hypothetical protein